MHFDANSITFRWKLSKLIMNKDFKIIVIFNAILKISNEALKFSEYKNKKCFQQKTHNAVFKQINKCFKEEAMNTSLEETIVANIDYWSFVVT